jgi:hypothetical protein
MVMLAVVLCAADQRAAAQQPAVDHSQHQQGSGQPDAQTGDAHDMQHMNMDHAGMNMSAEKQGSGTSWQPDDTPMFAAHRQAGAWMLMAHGSAFVQYLREAGARGSDQAGSINWFMGMADRSLGDGHLGFRAMISLEPWTVRGCGYPDLLASGELCNGEAIHDRQHPHDLLMETAATYDRPLAGGLRLQLYGGPAGEPALGPTAFPHRLSAMASPIAPIAHHWLDATHISYGVATAGVYARRWKVESSVFNGREPDEQRADADFAALDSWSGRVWFAPDTRWSFQVSAGRLEEAEAAHHAGDPRVDLVRTTASATYHRIADRRIWASTIAWGRNAEAGGPSTTALLAESSLSLDDRDVWFARAEVAGKSGHDLDLDPVSPQVFTVGKIAAGYTRYVRPRYGLQPGAGIGVSAGIVPRSLVPAYGRRVNMGVGIYLTLRPARRAEE